MDRCPTYGPLVTSWMLDILEVLGEIRVTIHGPHLQSTVPSTGRGWPLSVAPATSRKYFICYFSNLGCYTPDQAQPTQVTENVEDQEEFFFATSIAGECNIAAQYHDVWLVDSGCTHHITTNSNIC
uniref:Gag-pol polyprotein n=1 Tax=Solanum tuberosum TaxID=4113 RepID=M1DU32_SOLTU